MAEHIPKVFPSGAEHAVDAPFGKEHQDNIEIRADDYFLLESGKNITVKAGDENVLIIAGVDTPQFSGEQQQHRIILVSGYGDPDEEGVDVDIAIPPRRGISLNAASEIILKAPKITFIGTVEIKGGDLLVRENVVCDKIVSDSTGSGVIAAP